MKSFIQLAWLGLVAGLPQPTGSGGSVSSTGIDVSATGPVSSLTESQLKSIQSLLPTARDREAGTHSGTSPSPSTTSITTKTKTKSHTPRTSEIFTRTWEVTATRTAFVPVSSSIYEAGSKTYYSTWLTVAYPTTVVTSTEFATSIIQPSPQTIKTTVAPSITPLVTFGCVCPAAITETVYVMATQGPATTITSAILHTYTSTLLDGQTMVTVVPVRPTSILESTSQVEASTNLINPGPQTSPTIPSQTIGTSTDTFTAPRGTGNRSPSSTAIVTQISDGQPQAPQRG